ncbi:hypothetical protein Q3A86_31870 [Streptomyces sp. NBUA17]
MDLLRVSSAISSPS